MYLTFDDGPSKLTDEVLDILKGFNIHATFFVLGEQVKRFPELVTRAVEEGHALGNHSYNHNYEELYKGFSPFWSQIKQTEETIRSVTGLHTSLVRAPGGTAGHFDDTYFTLLKEGGYQVVDWNVDSGDSKRRGVPARDIIKDATTNINNDQVVVLMHDGNGHEETVKALPEIISYYKDKGYKFDVLTPELPKLESFQFKVTKSARALQRPQPNEEWIATNVLPNAALFTHGKRLVMEIGRLETDFKHGEYRIFEGRIMVPLRTMMDKMDVSVKWDVKNKLAVIDMGLNSLQISVATGDWTSNKKETASQTKNVPVQMKGNTLWVPLREILSATGHDPISINVNEEEWRIRAL
ncbi:polysaccharide deacetylase [Paenibacillus glacialis]|uniref:Polysaccharide deacetylase n=1 Tax=Paenibacillus glacialis TaxID=494026 RepID=A0A168IPM5_9BACL|nr:polysaccharide deacetylase [Paenibacillus glacialis]